MGEKRKEPSKLTLLFRRRLREQMAGMSHNELARRTGGAVSVKSVSRVLQEDPTKEQQVPTLDTVDALAAAIGLPAWYLMVEKDEAGHEIIKPPQTPKVVGLPQPFYPPVFSSPRATYKARRRRNR
jgi:transcriptional regulator with XRE-family HTH domain